MRVCRYIANNLLTWLTKASIYLQFLISNSGSIWFLLESLTRWHLFILVIARIIGSITLKTWITSCSCTILACSDSWLKSNWISVHWILASTSWASLRPSKLSCSKLSCLTIILVYCDFLVPFLIFQSLSYKWFIILSNDAGIYCWLQFRLS